MLYSFAGVPRNNKHEAAFEAYAIAKGCRTTKRGWPDFLCWRLDGSAFVVEVKPPGRNGKPGPLKLEQIEVMELLSRHGIECWVSSGETFERYVTVKHGRRFERRRRRSTASSKLARRLGS